MGWGCLRSFPASLSLARYSPVHRSTDPRPAGPVEVRLAHSADPSLLLLVVTSSQAAMPSASVGRALLAASPAMDGALAVTVVSGE